MCEEERTMAQLDIVQHAAKWGIRIRTWRHRSRARFDSEKAGTGVPSSVARAEPVTAADFLSRYQLDYFRNREN